MAVGVTSLEGEIRHELEPKFAPNPVWQKVMRSISNQDQASAVLRSSSAVVPGLEKVLGRNPGSKQDPERRASEI
jgi:hypothetical protein